LGSSEFILYNGFESGFTGFRGFLSGGVGWDGKRRSMSIIFLFCIHLTFGIIGVYSVLWF
jgi:hypothetical protein